MPKYFEIASMSKNRSLNVRVFTVGAKSGEYGGQSIFMDGSHGKSGIVSWSVVMIERHTCCQLSMRYHEATSEGQHDTVTVLYLSKECVPKRFLLLNKNV